jgi:hypothetical protein
MNEEKVCTSLSFSNTYVACLRHSILKGQFSRGQCHDFKKIFYEKNWKKNGDFNSKCCYFMQKWNITLTPDRLLIYYSSSPPKTCFKTAAGLTHTDRFTPKLTPSQRKKTFALKKILYMYVHMYLSWPKNVFLLLKCRIGQKFLPRPKFFW